MSELLKPVRFGILIGLLGLVFGIGWAIWLVVGHDRIHESFEQRMEQGIYEHGSAYASQMDEPAHVHGSASEPGEPGEAETAKPHFEGGHDDPIMELAHTRLRWAHVHYMGLGLLTIAVSLVLVFTAAPGAVKGITSIILGFGGLIYPSGWIFMGYRTPSLGPDAALASVATIAGPGIVLVLLGIVTTVFFLLRDIFSKDKRNFMR